MTEGGASNAIAIAYDLHVRKADAVRVSSGALTAPFEYQLTPFTCKGQHASMCKRHSDGNRARAALEFVRNARRRVLEKAWKDTEVTLPFGTIIVEDGQRAGRACMEGAVLRERRVDDVQLSTGIAPREV